MKITSVQLTPLGLSIAYHCNGLDHYLLCDPRQTSLLMCDTGFLQSREFLKGSLVVKKSDWWYRFDELHLHYSVSDAWAVKFIERHEENELFKSVLTELEHFSTQIQLN